MRALYRVKFQESNSGRDGGLGNVKSFKTRASNPGDAAHKIRKKGARIISVRRVK